MRATPTVGRWIMNTFASTATIALIAAIAAIAAFGLAGAVLWGGPKAIAPLESINAPFKGLDYRQMPAISRYTARDGTPLAYRHYRSQSTAANATAPRRVVLVHGSSASSRSMHPMAMALLASGFAVDVLDIRGHGDSGQRGHIAYIGQLEHDLADFMQAVPHAGPSTLLGFSAGAGFVLRHAASPQKALFDRYVLLAPFVVQAPTNRPTTQPIDGNRPRWASVGLPRIVALSILNGFGVTRWNDLPVTQFALNAEAAKFLTPRYSYALAANFGTNLDYQGDIRRLPPGVKLIAGVDDELMFSGRYAELFKTAGHAVPVTLAPGANHMGLTLNAPALAVVAAACHD